MSHNALKQRPAVRGMNFGKKLAIGLFLLVCSLSCKGCDALSPRMSMLEREAKAYVDEVLPKILARWDSSELIENASPALLKQVSREVIEQQFFAFMRMGSLTHYGGAEGHVSRSTSSADNQTTVTGDYVTKADFEAGHASITVQIVKGPQNWSILGFLVKPDSSGEASPTPEPSAAKDAKREAPSRDDLERAVSKVPEGDILALRRNVASIFELAQLYEKEGRSDEAIALYEKGLQADPANLQKQLKLASLLLGHNREKEAVSRLQSVVELAEEDALFQEATALLERCNKSNATPRKVLPGSSPGDPTVLLVPIGSPSRQFVSELRAALQERLGLSVSISERALDPGEADRKRSDVTIRRVFDSVSQSLNPLQRDAILRDLGLNGTDLDSPAQQSRFIMAFSARAGLEGLRLRQQFEAELSRLGPSGQYDMARLARELRRFFPVDESETVRCYLGVLSADAYAADCDNCYGQTDGVYGVITSYRFGAANNGEEQNRPRLLARTVKQALSSVNLALGMVRCTTPFCARSFPHSLSVHDAKSDQLCRDCRERLQAFRQNPRSHLMAIEYVRIADSSLEKQELDKTIALCEKAVWNDSEFGSAYERLGSAYWKKGLKDKASANFQKALAYPPGSANAHAFFGDQCLAARDLKQAVEHYSRALEARPDFMAVQYMIGKAYTDLNEIDKAIEHLEIARKGNPQSADTQFLLGICYDKQGRALESIDAWEKAIAANPRFAEAHYGLGLALVKTGKKDLALNHFKQATTLSPAHFNALVQLGRLYGGSGLLDDSESAFKAALALKPDDANEWNDLGYTCFLKKDNRQAIAHYEKAIALQPDLGIAHYNKALAHAAEQEFDLAIAHLDRATASGYAGSPQFRQLLAPHR